MGIREIAFRTLINNFIGNLFIRALGLEKIIYSKKNPYLNFKPKELKSTQENAGYSNRPEINEVLEKSKSDLQIAVNNNCMPGAAILDIGCGPGMYLELFNNSPYELHATDLNKDMIAIAKKNVQKAAFYTGDFLKLDFNRTYSFIYCIGMLIYIPRYQLEAFFKKIYNLLKPGGVFYLNYPHAISIWDVLYNDLSYILYSPKRIEKAVSGDFEIIKHEHAFDGRKIGAYDHNAYKSLNPSTKRTYKNSYVLIIRKK